MIAAEDEFRNVRRPRWPSTVVAGIRALALMKPAAASRRAAATRILRDPVGEVMIVRREPRIAFRVVENQMNYAYLGDRLSQSAADNFPVFVADLCAAPTPPTSLRRPDRCSRTGRRRRVRIPQLAGPARLRDPSPALELVQPRSRRAVAHCRPGHETLIDEPEPAMMLAPTTRSIPSPINRAMPMGNIGER